MAFLRTHFGDRIPDNTSPPTDTQKNAQALANVRSDTRASSWRKTRSSSSFELSPRASNRTSAKQPAGNVVDERHKHGQPPRTGARDATPTPTPTALRHRPRLTTEFVHPTRSGVPRCGGHRLARRAAPMRRRQASTTARAALHPPLVTHTPLFPTTATPPPA